MKKTLLLFFAAILFISCIPDDDCPQNINILPMYGRAKKCLGQLRADTLFLADCDKNFETRTEAAKYFVGKGWSYFYKNKIDTAMMRFNQAWMLDSLNADTYWGFGIIAGTKKKFKESIPFFNRSTALDPSNAKVWECVASSHLQLYEQTKKNAYRDAGITSLKRSIHLEPDNARVLSQLAAAYCYFDKKDSAAKYLKLTDKIDKNAIHPNVRKVISSQMAL